MSSSRMASVVLGLGATGLCVFGNVAAVNDTVHFGDPVALGQGEVRAFVALDSQGATRAIGVRMSVEGLRDLPAEPDPLAECFDGNSDGVIDPAHECLGHYTHEPPWPTTVAEASHAPWSWISLDWNPHGHEPPGVYDQPHFDLHFYIMPRDEVMGIRLGTCGLVDCDDRARAMIPIAESYAPPGYANVDAVVPKMGAHLIDLSAPELGQPPEPFTHTLIYGAYDGKITFMEPMITSAFLASGEDMCAPIRQPALWAIPGWYPTQYCVRHDRGEGAVDVTLEGMLAH